MTRKFRLIALPLLLGVVVPAQADTPAFDRPGISFATTTVPAGGVALELGVPDFQRDTGADGRSTFHGLSGIARIGIADQAEVQVGSALFNHSATKIDGVSERHSGYGDTSLALKYALPSRVEAFTWAVLGGVTFPTGAKAFSAGRPQYDFGTTLKYDLNETYSGVLYGNYTRLDGHNTYTVSPSVLFALTKTFGAFTEAGVSYVERGADSVVAGGGITWMPFSIVQLDLFADFGVTSASPDVQAGFGVSIYFE
jgi:hypothetical protein